MFALLQNSLGVMFSEGIKLYSCISLVQSVLSKSYMIATTGLSIPLLLNILIKNYI